MKRLIDSQNTVEVADAYGHLLREKYESEYPNRPGPGDGRGWEHIFGSFIDYKRHPGKMKPGEGKHISGLLPAILKFAQDKFQECGLESYKKPADSGHTGSPLHKND